ncbi:serine hydrolase domain-containing protein [Catenuloplanes atrovinosus]|uniref:CubicO group peptidase (Beta-lactamase class C family) n=1 Tax=Catenuloplanes atrovinosus TaxID=137266 RepID=A0AAE4C838_9ACTN|nr:serine hydrolase domain-containing protein [Catenuloplanes atrovinosus]MDR7273374.1 CubicO group peptidase (beta-lactamase class C family) [Catenuloplanes atrovinosus]
MSARPQIVAAVVVAVLAVAAALVAGPRPPSLGPERSGDAALAQRVRDAVEDPDGYRGLSVAYVESGAVRYAGLGDDRITPDTAFEIGSVTKALTGMLLADLETGGVLRAQDTLGALLPGTAGPAASITAEELASHRAGLPRLPPLNPVSLFLRQARAADPYAGIGPDDVAREIGETGELDGRGEVHYSNYGASVLGLALATRAGTPYPRLLTDRILTPLGMGDTVFTLDGAAPPPGAAEGATPSGRPAAPWTASGTAPAGVGAWSTAADLGRLLTALLAGTAPGQAATADRFDADPGQRIGYGWFTRTADDRRIVWHNGGTGGFSAFVAFEPATGRGVAVLGDTARSVDPIGLRLLGADPPADSRSLPEWAVTVVTGFLLLAGASLFTTAIGPVRIRGRRVWGSAPDRLQIVEAALISAGCLTVARVTGDWLVVQPWLWAVACGLSAAGAVHAVTSWRGLPLVTAGGTAASRWTSLTVSAAMAVALTGLFLLP